jgi:anti-anti-sigma regulatory factor
MTIKLERAEGNAQVSILSVEGALDASNFQRVIDIAKQAVDGGAKYLLIDMSKISFMSSSGIVALHSIALLMRGELPPDPEHGWEALRAIDRDLESGIQENVKLLSPQPKVDRSLQITGMKEFLEIHTDLDTAIASFE